MGATVSGNNNRFDEAAATWDEEPGRVKLARAVADAIARQIQLSADMDVLDFGCGTGLLTLALLPHVHSVTGADASSGMIDVLRGKLQAQKLGNVETILLDPGAPLSLDARFHLIVSSMALHHVADLGPLFARFYEQLRPGGQVALADLDREDGSFHEDSRGVFHLGFERDDVAAHLAGAGFVDLGFTTATIMQKAKGSYPIFLATGRRPR
jgi:cyclopropane fatty-acyl-phospholipid synthase-like methyltransferase